MVPGWLRTPKSVFWLDDPVLALSAVGRLWPSSGNLKKITLMKTLWFAVRYFNRQEQIPQVSPMPIKHHHQLQLDLVFSVTEAYNSGLNNV